MIEQYLGENEKIRPLGKTKNAALNAIKDTWLGELDDSVSFPPDPSDSQDVPKSPYKSVSMYFGLEGYTTNPQIKILKINFKRSGKWPESDFTYYAEKRVEPQYLSRKVLRMRLQGAVQRYEVLGWAAWHALQVQMHG